MLPRVLALIRRNDELALAHLAGQQFDGVLRQVELDPLGEFDDLSLDLRNLALGLYERHFFLLLHDVRAASPIPTNLSILESIA